MFVIKQVDGDGICNDCEYFAAVSNHEHQTGGTRRNKIYCKYYNMCNYAVCKYKAKRLQDDLNYAKEQIRAKEQFIHDNEQCKEEEK